MSDQSLNDLRVALAATYDKLEGAKKPLTGIVWKLHTPEEYAKIADNLEKEGKSPNESDTHAYRGHRKANL